MAPNEWVLVTETVSRGGYQDSRVWFVDRAVLAPFIGEQRGPSVVCLNCELASTIREVCEKDGFLAASDLGAYCSAEGIRMPTVPLSVVATVLVFITEPCPGTQR